MLVAQSRPRNLKWYHAGPLLFGDWGTSRLYVLGLAFYYTGHASTYYLAAMSVIMAAVAWAYTIICRCFPEGGGVYSSARRLSPTLAVIGATLLLCDYIITASLSTVEAFHYFGAPSYLVLVLSVGALLALGVVNWFGARNSGRMALGVALAAIAVSLVIAVLAVPFVKEGTHHIGGGHPTISSPWSRWQSLVQIMLALSGVEAVANMTGLMREPVTKTSKRTIWPVLIEVVLLNTLFGLALMGLPGLRDTAQPDFVTYVVQGAGPDSVPADVLQYRDTAVKLVALKAGIHILGPAAGAAFGTIAAVIFGLLLLSASNTAIMDMIAVQYAMGKDDEIPPGFTKLNYSGVPWLGLLTAAIVPGLVLIVERDVALLADLYAVGVVGAISINILCCAVNRKLEIRGWERHGLWVVGTLMLCVELTIIVTKVYAAIFAGSLVALVLVTRQVRSWRRVIEAERIPEPATGWLAELRLEPTKLAPGQPRIMLAARGRYQSEFAVDLAKRRGAVLFVIYVRTLRVIDVQPGAIPKIEEDRTAQESLGTTAILARNSGVPFVPIYVTGTDIPAEILDYTVTYGCDTLIMGKSRRSLFARKVAGDVVAKVAEHLPDNVALITRSPDAPHVPGMPRGD
jgi:amino acid transporter